MKKLIYIAAAFAVLACSGTQDNDPWGKIDEDRAKEAAEDKANEGKVLELSMSSSIMKQTMTYSVWLPREYDENREYPFLYLLHGYEYGDQSRLDRCGWIKATLQQLQTNIRRMGELQ